MKRCTANFLFKCILILGYTALHTGQVLAQMPSLITSAPGKNTDSINVGNILKRSMFIKVIISSNKVFVGEPVMALYKFYTSVNGQAVVLKQPEFSGCSVKELNFEDGLENETINGETYTSYIIRKVQLTPVEPGILSIGVATVTNHVEVQGEDVFVPDKYDISVSNNPESVAVAPLPEKNKPGTFYGITGLFSITASASENQIPVDENDHLIITIKGTGNLDAVNKPEIIWPPGTEHFDGSDSQHVDQDNFPISGDRVFDIPFIGKKEGTVKLPPVSFSYFNTTLKNYETITTDSIAVNFTKALAKNDEYTGVVNDDVSNKKYLWIVAAIALTVALIGFINYRRNKIQLQKKLSAQPSITPVPVFEPAVKFKYKTDFSRYWDDLQNLKDTKSFFAKAKELLMKAVSEKTDSQHHSEAFLMAELKQSTNAELFEKTYLLIEVCNEKIYAPFATDTDLELYLNEVKMIIGKLQSVY